MGTFLLGCFIIACIGVGIGLIIGVVTSYNEYKFYVNSDCSSNLRKSTSGYYGGHYDVNEIPDLPFEKFKNFYCINPDSWDLEQGIAYKKDEKSRYVSAIAFRPFSNYTKYENFREQIEKNKEKIHIDEVHKKLLTVALESVQTDITDLQNQARREYEEAEERFKITIKKGMMI